MAPDRECYIFLDKYYLMIKQYNKGENNRYICYHWSWVSNIRKYKKKEIFQIKSVLSCYIMNRVLEMNSLMDKLKVPGNSSDFL